MAFRALTSKIFSTVAAVPRATVRGLATAAKGKYPTPPVAASVGLQFEDDAMDPRINPNLPYEIDESEGVSVLKFKEGKFQGEEVVLAHMSATLEWVLPSPPPLHTFDESPIVKEHPDEFTDVY